MNAEPVRITRLTPELDRAKTAHSADLGEAVRDAIGPETEDRHLRDRTGTSGEAHP